MNNVPVWFREQVSPSRGFYSVLLRSIFRVYSRNLRWMLAISISAIVILLMCSPIPHLPSSLPVLKSSYDWSNYTYYHPLESITPLPTGKPRLFPPIQYSFQRESKSAAEQRIARQQAVVKTFKKGWQSYKTHAWLEDELRPISGQYKNQYGGWAATLVDSLDTLWIMGLKAEFYEAAAAAARIDWANTTDTACNMFETNIRYLGGLLAAFELSREPALLAKAIELADMLYAGFDTPNHLPPFWLDFEKAKNGQLVAETRQISAAVGTFSLEFTRLSQITGDPKYYDVIARVTSVLVENQASTKLPGMWPTFINAREQIFQGDSFSVGALADSLYEYLPKMHYLLGGLEPVYEKAYRDSMATAIKHLLFRPMLPDQADILVIGSVDTKNREPMLNPEGQHLTCFAGGMFILGGKFFSIPEHLDIGARLTHRCIYAYDAFPTGIMPERFRMRPCPSLEPCEWDQSGSASAMEYSSSSSSQVLPEGFDSVSDLSYSLRPEALESVFILYRTTGNPELLDAAWRMFESIQAATETEYGNAAIRSVLDTNATTTTNTNTSAGAGAGAGSGSGSGSQIDSMESFWFAETLKYLYLIFSAPDVISLDEYVFNTEAHPFKRPR